jgi:hypothetical protein
MAKLKAPKKQDSYVAGGHNIGFITKVALRRYFLETYHKDEPIRVFDCCQGEGAIWGKLRTEFPVAEYWGVDNAKEKLRAGRLVIDSKRILAQGVRQNVIDVDTYGSPWKHWLALLAARNDSATLTVFLTFGRGTFGSGWDDAMVDSLGLRFKRLTLPDGLIAKVCSVSGIQHCLGRAGEFGYKIVDCREAIPHRDFKVEVGHARKARYFGVRIAKAS